MVSGVTAKRVVVDSKPGGQRSESHKSALVVAVAAIPRSALGCCCLRIGHIVVGVQLLPPVLRRQRPATIAPIGANVMRWQRV